MENNQTDFMKNRPVASYANQVKDVYGSQKKSTLTTVSAVLGVVDLILIIIAIILGNKLMLIIFIPVFVLFLISFFVGRRADRQNLPVEPQEDDPEAIFKDHQI